MSGGSYFVAAREEEDKYVNTNYVRCEVLLLDGHTEHYLLQKKSDGQCLLDYVFDTLGLIEKDFFGLQFKESHPSSGKYNKWLTSTKSIRKQITGNPPYCFHFRVRFYPSNPTQMREEYTRYLLFLQLKKDILEDRLYCNREMAAILASYALQSELGDYNAQKHESGYVLEFKFIKYQTPEFDNEVSNLHMKRRNLSPSMAESEYLTLASQMNYYGVDIFNALTLNKDIVQIGPSSLGFNVFQNKQRLHLFLWSSIFKISFKKKKLTVQIKSKDSTNGESLKTSHLTHVYILSSFPLCKCLWQNCVDYHTFFRVKSPACLSQCKQNCKNSRSNLFNISVTPAFGGRRTMPVIQDLQKRSRLADRNFMRTPTSLRKVSNTKTETIIRSPILQTSVVSRSSGTLSSNRSNETVKIHSLKHPNSFQNRSLSQSSLESKPLHASFDSDRSSLEDDDINEIKDELPNSASFFVPDSYVIERGGVKGDKILSSGKTISLTLNRRNNSEQFKVLHTSIDESSDSVLNKSLSSDLSLESLPDINKSSINQSFSMTTPSFHSKINYIPRLVSSLNIQKKTPNAKNGVRNTSTKPTNFNSYNGDDDHLIIKMRCDRYHRYGFTLGSSSERGAIITVNHIAKNSPADTCFPRLNIGDQILSINSHSISQLNQDEVVSLIKRCAESNTGELIIAVKANNYIVENSTDSSIWDIPCSQSRLTESTRERRLSSAISEIDSTASGDPLKQSMKLLEIALETDEILQQFEAVYRRKPGFTMNEARKSENYQKNRYRDISPYDQTRVVLKSSKSSDYINASIINMKINSKGLLNRYIAAQGPLLHTSVDFWQMCWEQNAQLIVMLTALSEQGRPKCHKYWPPIYETVEFGDYQISCLSEEYSEDGGFAVRDLMVYCTETKEQRRIQHMQYISWPDHGVPTVHYEFISFVYKVRKYRSNHIEPIIVHCSAGIGRTGVLITMETAMCLIEANEPVDPIDILQSMRDQRASMIQTPAQFKFVCEAILKVFRDTELRTL